jgi:hypothetical protein
MERKNNMDGYNEDFRFEGEMVRVRLSGKFPKDLPGREVNLFQPLVDACSSHNCKKALIDARDLQVDFGTMEMFRAAADAAFVGRVGIRIALLAREAMLDQFFAHVVHKRGENVGIFTDVGAAREWLQR